MKMEYESPMLEILSFDIQNPVMDSSCPYYQGVCPLDGVCSIDIPICITDGTYPNVSSV